jgi:hypothetical protein
MELGRQRAEAWLADLTRAQREADRNAQEPAQLGAGAEIAGRDSRRCQPEQIAAQEGSGAARACACACPARALLRKCRDTLSEVQQTYGPEPGARVIGLSAILSELDAALGARP